MHSCLYLSRRIYAMLGFGFKIRIDIYDVVSMQSIFFTLSKREEFHIKHH